MFLSHIFVLHINLLIGRKHDCVRFKCRTFISFYDVIYGRSALRFVFQKLIILDLKNRFEAIKTYIIVFVCEKATTLYSNLPII